MDGFLFGMLLGFMLGFVVCCALACRLLTVMQEDLFAALSKSPER